MDNQLRNTGDLRQSKAFSAKKRFFFPILFLLLGLVTIPLEPGLFFTLREILEKLPLKHLYAIALQFANPFLPIIIAATIVFLDRKRRHLVIYLVLAMLVAGAVNSSVKELAGRRRPEWSVALNEEREADLRKLAQKHPGKFVPVERRDIWGGLRRDRVFFLDKDASFPSGHACAAFSLAAFLCFVYPRGRIVWLTLAVLSALVRVKSAHHYPSDIMVGGALAWLISQWVFSWQWPLRLMERLSSRWLSSSTQENSAARMNVHFEDTSAT